MLNHNMVSKMSPVVATLPAKTTQITILNTHVNEKEFVESFPGEDDVPICNNNEIYLLVVC